MEKHAFWKLAEAQKKSGTLYCGGFDIHPQKDLADTWEANMQVYGFRNGGKVNSNSEAFDFYDRCVFMEGLRGVNRTKYAGLLTAIEDYLFHVLEISVRKCNLSVFKPQFGLYIQFGPSGAFLLQRLRNKIRQLAEEVGRILVAILDAKPGDISTTQAGYLLGYLGNLLENWGVDHSAFDFDIVNPTPWMGSDTLCLEEKGKDGTTKSMIGLELLRKGKGLAWVNWTSNPSGRDYQDLLVRKAEENEEMTLYMRVAKDMNALSKKHDLEAGEISQLAMVIGATVACDGSIRAMFPTYNGLGPGFGAQSKEKLKKDPLAPFKKLILECRRDEKWNGQGQIWSSSRNHLFPWKEEYGGSGNVEKLEQDLIRAVNEHRALEEEVFNLPHVIDVGIKYPFAKAA